MKISKYGLDNFFGGILAGIFLILFAYFFALSLTLTLIFSVLGLFLILFSIWFFRDPERFPPEVSKIDNSIILSPADGKVIEISETNEPKFLRTQCQKISIFLSPLDVHVNRSPMTGIIEHFEYNPGKYLVAYHPKASDFNEHTFIGMSNEFGKIAFKQIAGTLARRVVCSLKVGQKVSAGERIGMMKFGSRMDIYLPTQSQIFVNLNQKVVGGVTILAKLNTKKD